MVGSGFKGILYLSTMTFALLGIAAVLPESAWEQVPAKIVPVRTFLAERGVINEKFLPVSEDKEAAQAIIPLDGFSDQESTKDQTSEHSPLQLTPVQECPGGVCPVPAFHQPDSIPQKETADSALPSELPALNPIPDVPERISVEQTAAEQAVSEQSVLPVLPNSPVSSPVPLSADTLPDLSFGNTPDPISPAAVPVAAASVAAASVAAGVIAEASSTDTSPAYSIPANPIPANPQAVNTAAVNQEIPETIPVFGAFPADPVSASQPDAVSAVSAEISPSESAPLNSADSAVGFSTSGGTLLTTRLDNALARSVAPDQTWNSFCELNQILNESGENLSPNDRLRLNLALDRLAYDVFYSPEANLAEPPYLVQPQETLAQIAARYNVEPELLAVLNQLAVGNNDPLTAGTRLKVVRGPISAQVSFKRMELLLKINGLYAGRFKMGCAAQATAVRGTYTITRKILRPDYNGPLPDGQIGTIAGGNPANPLGPCWIELAGGLGLQGTNRPELIGQSNAATGGLIFSNKDITHLNILLPVGAVVEIVD